METPIRQNPSYITMSNVFTVYHSHEIAHVRHA